MALKSEKLDSGLTVYVDHMPNARTNSTNMFIPYGSVNELEGDEGMAHAFEHCVHLETDQFANRTDLARHAKLHGMQTNANTYYTRTVYYANA